MSRMVIVLGDPTTGGDIVISGSPFTDIDGKPVARIGDKATCQKCKGVFPIVTGDVTFIIDGHSVAREGDYLACGCRLIAVRQFRVFLDESTSDNPAADAAMFKASNVGGSGRTKTFDEAVQFLSYNGTPLGRIDYRLFLVGGKTIEGTTDDEGRTQRVVTDQPAKVTKAELTSPEVASCCGMPAKRVGGASHAPSVTLEQEGATVLLAIVTHDEELGSSVAKVYAEKRCRKLTAGEISMARLIFSDGLDYAAVDIHEHGYWLFFGLQDEQTAVTPNGNVFFPPRIYSEDFSKELPVRQALLIHELTHAWQHQLGYPVIRTRGPRPQMSYQYTLKRGKRFNEYNMEQQGNILGDYFLIKFRSAQSSIEEFQYRGANNVIPLYEQTLENFFRNPAYALNLPENV